jgi:tryptophan synthase alpha chain
MTMKRSLNLAANMRSTSETPIVLMSYCNPIFRMGVEEFATATANAGVTGVIVPDLPIEEAHDLRNALTFAGVHLIYLLSPASTIERIAATAATASGFIYCMALTGVTGARARLAEDLPAFLARVRTVTTVPLIVGFGISKPAHLKELRGVADGAVVASALVDLIERLPPEGRDAAIATFVKELKASCSGS